MSKETYAQLPDLIDSIERHRRTKNETDGRMYECEECGKKYLSQAAVNNHKKTKHPDKIDPNEEKRGRGRPRKNFGVFNNDPDTAKFENFYTKERKKNENEPIEIVDVVNSVFTDIFMIFAEKTVSHPKVYSENALLNTLYNELPLLKKKAERTIDDVFYEYMLFSNALGNKKIFTLQLKCLLLLREYINKINQAENSEEYTTKNFCDEIPNMLNGFVSDFLEPNSYFGLNEDDKKEIIEIIQHIAYWLLKYDYTKYKLKLA